MDTITKFMFGISCGAVIMSYLIVHDWFLTALMLIVPGVFYFIDYFPEEDVE